MEGTNIELQEQPKLTYNIKEINKKIFSMILPITVENVLQMVAGIVSMGMVGRIDVLAVSALGISMRITQIVWALFKGIAVGATVFVAQYYGAGEHKKMLIVIQQTMLSAIAVVALLEVLIYIGAPILLSVFNPDAELMQQAVVYLRLVSLGLPFLAMMLIIGGVLQGMGNARTPMLITMTMNIVNIVVGYVLIFGKLGFPAIGIRGAAIATVISQITAVLLGVYVLFNKNGIMRGYFNKSFFSVDIQEVRKIYRVGLPSSMESVFWQLAAIIITRAILNYGETAFAAHQLGLQAESISYMPAAGFAIAATAFTGQALGAKDKGLAKLYFKQIMKGALVITVLCASILIFLPGPIMSLLTNNKEIIRLGSIYLILMGIVQLPQSATGVLSGAMRGAGFTKVPMVVAGVGLWGIRVPLVLIVAYGMKFSIVAIWSVFCIDLCVRFIICLVMYKRKNIYEENLILK
ncbi:MAG: efflux family protein [Clostridia bacterium]|nr:efflux family protein [Clostridia bacterium]